MKAEARNLRFIFFCSSVRVASLCKEWNLQEKENGRKMVDFGKVWNLQRMENARKNKVESAKKEIARMEIARNGICNEAVIQVPVIFFFTLLMYVNKCSKIIS